MASTTEILRNSSVHDELKGDPMKSLRGLAISLVVLDLVKQAQSSGVKPEEAAVLNPDSVLALRGDAYGSLVATRELQGSLSILPGGKSDSSIDFEMHDTTLAHLIGNGLEPHVTARRGKQVMASALTELAQFRWSATDFEQTAERALIDARLTGTAGVQTFRDPALGVARSSWIPVRSLVLDPTCEGDLNRTKFRAVVTFVYRAELRNMLRAWGADPELAQQAGRDMEFYAEPQQWNPFESMRREMERVQILDFYWCEGKFRRHIIIAQGIKEPVWDVDRWPYDLPIGKWPINVFPWNVMPGTVWGASDHKLVNMWSQGVSWMQRFLLDSAAEAAKVTPVFDRTIGDPDVIQRIFGDLRRSYGAVPLDLSTIYAANPGGLKSVIDFLNTPTSVDKLQEALTQAREIIGRTLGLDEMLGRVDNPDLMPPRLARRISRWKKFLACILEAESCADLTVIPRRSLVAIKEDGADPITGVPVRTLKNYQYVDLDVAESLERNQVPHAIRRGLTGEQWDASARREKELRLKDGIDNESQVDIVEPGIARYVSRDMLVDHWEGAIPGVALRADVEYTFGVDIIGSLAASEQTARRSSDALNTLIMMYKEWGIQEASYEWSDRFDKAAQANVELRKQGQPVQPLPQPPKMLLNVLQLHADYIRASGANPQALSLRPEDLARALAQGKRMMDEQAAAQAQAAAAAQPQEDPRKLELELMKMQIELRKLEIQAAAAQSKAEAERIQAETERIRQAWELKKQQNEEAKSQLEHARELQELPFRLAQTEARTASTIAQKDRALAAAQREVAKAQMEGQKAELESAVTQAEALVKVADAELKQIQAQKLAEEHANRADVPPDTKEAKEIAEAQRTIQETKTLAATEEKEKALADKAKADAEKARHDAKAPFGPPKPAAKPSTKKPKKR